jgi:hypothetical protein
MALSQSASAEQISRLIADYGWYADNRDIQTYSGLFIDDAVFESPKIILTGYYEVEVVKEGKGWRFARLTFHPDM